MIKWKVIPILLFMVFTGAMVSAHSPGDVSLEFNPETKILSVEVSHGVRDPAAHYIDHIEVMLNGTLVEDKKYEKQPDSSGIVETFKIEKAAAGDMIKVEAYCSISGKKGAEIKVPEPVQEKQVKEEQDKEKKESTMLKTGTKAPEFKLKDENGNTVQLKDFKGKKNVVLIFYPGDDTPGCKKQLCAVRDDYSKFDKEDVVVFGINPQGAKSHKKFIEKYNFPFPLLVDKDKKVVKKYGAKGTLFTKRTVYGIDKEGKIVFAKRGMPENEEILKALRKDHEERETGEKKSEEKKE